LNSELRRLALSTRESSHPIPMTESDTPEAALGVVLHQNPSPVVDPAFVSETPSSTTPDPAYSTVQDPALEEHTAMPPVTAMPDYSLCGRYDGTVPASRWLARLAFDMKRAGIPAAKPDDFFEAVEILFDGDAATWLDSSPRYRRMVDNRESAKQEDIDEFKQALVAEFPAKIIQQTEGNVRMDIKPFAQQSGEPLQAYYQRALHLLRRAHGRDDPRDKPGSKPLEPIERVVLSDIVSAFIEGIDDSVLRSAALARGVNSCGSLSRALEIVQETQDNIASIKEIEQRLAEKREYEQMKEYCTQQWGRPASAVLAEMRSGQVGFPRAATASNTAQYGVGYPTNLAPSTATAAGYFNNAQTTPAPPVVTNTQKTQPYRPPQSRGDSSTTSGDAASIAQDTPSTSTASLSNSANPRGGNNTSRGKESRTGGNNNGYANPKREMPPRNLSRNAFINGSSTYNRSSCGLLCVKCGVCGHLPAECTNDALEHWETKYLKWIVFGGEIPTSYLATLEADYDKMYEASHGRWEQCATGPSTASSIKSGAPILTPGTGAATPVTTPSSERVTEIEDFTLEQFSKLSVDCNSNTLGFQSPTDPAHVSTPDQPKTSNILSVDALVGEAARKWARIEISDIVEDDAMFDQLEDDAAEKSAKKTHKAVKKNLRQLREIVGRQGLGPIDYRALAGKIQVPLSLLDLFQISPDLAKAFRTLSTRVNKKSTKVKSAEGDANLAVNSAAASSKLVGGITSVGV
jgi:hypothetical protein